MLALLSLIPLETVLYGLLAYAAASAAMTERQAGHDRLSHHHGLAAVVYALLGVAHLLHV
jgi:hypothetical protein